MTIFYKITIAPVWKNLPLFVIVFLLLWPMWIKVAATNPFSAITCFFMPFRKVSCDLYITILITWICTILTTYISNRIKCIIYSIAIFSFITRLYLKLMFSMKISLSTLNFIMETNENECIGFIKQYIISLDTLFYFGLIILIVVLIFYLENKWKKFSNIIPNMRLQGFMSTIFFLMAFIGVLSFTQYKYLDNDTNTLTACMISYENYKANKNQDKIFYSKIKETQNCNEITGIEDSLNVIYIIGESYIKQHAYIYGYDLLTTPNMLKEKKSENLYCYDDVVSEYNYTTPSLKNLLCISNIKKSNWYSRTFLPQVFNKAGFTVAVFDNQCSKDAASSSSFYQMYSRLAQKYSYNYVHNKSYYFDDMKIVDDMSAYCKTLNQNNAFIFVHLVGQHFPFSERYPKKENIFKANDIQQNKSYLDENKKKRIAEYDNATLYNDKVWNNIISNFRNKNAIAIYVSDHGEEVYDYRDAIARPSMDENMKSEYVHCQHDCPLIIWCSDEYIKKHRKFISEIKSSISKPLSTENIGHLILHLSTISCPQYCTSLDILDSNYIAPIRMIHLRGSNRTFDYDKIK